MKSLILASILVLSGCCAKDVIYKDRIVEKKVPVYEKVSIDIPKKPVYPVDTTNNNASPEEKVRSLDATNKLKDNYIEKLLELLKPYAKKENDNG